MAVLINCVTSCVKVLGWLEKKLEEEEEEEKKRIKKKIKKKKKEVEQFCILTISGRLP